MKRIIIFIAISLCLPIHISADDIITNVKDYNYVDYYQGKGETVTVRGIIYVLNPDGTATAIGSPTTETGYNTITTGYYDPKSHFYSPYGGTTTYHSPTTFEFENYLDSCDGVFIFPEYVMKDGEKYTVTTISMVQNKRLEVASPVSSQYNYYDVPYAWAYCYESNIEIVLPKTVTTIDDYAFYSDKIKKIRVHNNLKKIGNYAFGGLKTMIVVEKGETGDRIITLPDGLTTIGTEAFSGLGAITTVRCNQNLENIQYRAFKNCTQLTSFDFPPKVKTISSETFSGCTKLERVTLNNVSNIYSKAFYGCENLKDIDFGHVVNIGSEAFSGCKALESVESLTVEKIQNKAFYGCENLKEAYLGNAADLDEEVFSGCAKLETVDLSSVKTIGAKTFNGCKNLVSVTLSNVTNIGANTFSNCKRLKEIDLAHVEEIGDGAFMYCDSLQSVYFENKVKLGSKTFFGCDRLEDLDLNNVSYLGAQALAYCSSLDLSKPDLSGISYIGQKAFENTNLSEINVPKSTQFGAAPFSGNEIYKLTFEEGTDSIASSLLTGVKVLIDSIAIPEGITRIGQEALGIANERTSTNKSDFLPILSLPSTLKTVGPYFLGITVERFPYYYNYDVHYLNHISYLVVLAETPPTFIGTFRDWSSNSVTYTENANNVYSPLGCQLGIPIYVPNGTLRAYQKARGWRRYTNYHEMSELTGIGSVTIDDATEQGADDGIYYDLQGRKVMNPQKGVYIHQGKKVMIK